VIQEVKRTTRAGTARGRSRLGALHPRHDDLHAEVEAIRTAQEKFGKGKVMTGEQVRWGWRT
jgi:branched-chain amino acid transport system substrate-binding protein